MAEKPKVKFSLLFKFVIAIALLIVVTSVILTRFFLQKQADLYLETLKTKSETIVKNLSDSAELGVLISNKDMLSELLVDIQKDENVLFSAVLNPKKFILSLGKRDEFDLRMLSKLISKPGVIPEIEYGVSTQVLEMPELEYPSIFLVSPVLSRENVVLDEADLLYFSDLAQVDQGEVIGYSLVVVSTEIIEKAILRNQIISSIITFLVICLGVVIGYLFTNIIIRPIKSLMKANEIVATGNYTTQVEIISRDEVGMLSESFNNMVDKIRVQQEELLDYSRTLEDKVRERTAQLAAEKAKSDNLLLNILPVSIADRLKKKEETIADRYDEVTVLFSDLVGFTVFSAKHTPKELVYKLNILFSKFDDLLDKYKIEKIKTIGDALMLVSGAPRRYKNHAIEMAHMALDMYDELRSFNEEYGEALDLRIGLHTGPVVAGVMGKKKFTYDLWGDAVNTASRMESHGIPGIVHMSAATYEKIKDQNFNIEDRGEIEVKGKGMMHTYILKKDADTEFDRGYVHKK
ncbi:MAG: HAMP domain-containing protein [Candidatus Margulisbacteria bacterium]|nr:HAMP domain-containing protein [Candidatus Margulisiibacteriota bacterium]